jgi:Pyruvate/2-oxoacid:ferredoxin oxidoreductase delta subunit
LNTKECYRNCLNLHMCFVFCPSRAMISVSIATRLWVG